MSTRTRYVLAYDIREPGRLRRVHSVARAYGDPLQYSVFICDLTAVELIHLQDALRHEMDQRVDSVALIDLGPASGRGVRSVLFMGARRSLPRSGGAELW